ncbi:MAG: adenosylcobinamide-GDP ribazoletransferase [Candidatus Omnitrophica bacterium]|nr:adenosylcobinamide-GDP ribazoletransferase [Candidatus Omnitrophota bacterium]
MSRFLLALQFLTIFPIKIKSVSVKKLSGSLIYFPVVGLVIGLMLAALYTLLINLDFTSFATSVITVIALIIITGGMHFDGLADTFDALLSVRSKEEMLRIMRDPHIGVMGVLSIISIVILKIGLLSSIDVENTIKAIILMCALGRWSAVFLMFNFPYARSEGKAKVFIDGMNLNIFTLSAAIVILISAAIWQAKGLLILLVMTGVVYLFGLLTKKKIGGITGDTLGAGIELAECAILFSFIILERNCQWIN